jgi:hypothetical protein
VETVRALGAGVAAAAGAAQLAALTAAGGGGGVRVIRSLAQLYGPHDPTALARVLPARAAARNQSLEPLGLAWRGSGRPVSIMAA